MSIVFKGDVTKFISEEKKTEFQKALIDCKSNEDYDKLKAEDFLIKGYAYTMRKTTKELTVTIITEKEAKRMELRMRLRNKRNQLRYGNMAHVQKMKNEKKTVDKHLYKKYMKVIKSGKAGATLLSPSDIMNDIEKYGQFVSMMSSKMFSRDRVVQEYYEMMREHMGLPEFKMPEMKAEDHPSVVDKAGVIPSEDTSKVDLSNENDTEEEEEESCDDNECSRKESCVDCDCETTCCKTSDSNVAEATPEVTTEATTEATPEVTTEATTEVTPEATTEATTEEKGGSSIRNALKSFFS